MQTFHPSLPLEIEPATHLDLPLHEDRDAARRWQAHVDAGRIGGNPPTPPAVAAQRAANDALFRGIARDRARLQREQRA